MQCSGHPFLPTGRQFNARDQLTLDQRQTGERLFELSEVTGKLRSEAVDDCSLPLPKYSLYAVFDEDQSPVEIMRVGKATGIDSIPESLADRHITEHANAHPQKLL